MDVLGYTDRLSARPGDRIQFMVSSRQPSYQVDLVRLDRAFSQPVPAEDTVIPSTVAGHYPGREQPIYPGSYVVVPDAPALRFDRGLTLQAWIFTTLPDRGREQGLIAKWNATTGAGFGLGLSPTGEPVFWLGDGQGKTAHVPTNVPLQPGRWYCVAATYDATTGEARVAWMMLRRRWLPEEAGAAVQSIAMGPLAANDVPLLLGATHLEIDKRGRPAAHGCYNGKIDRPRLWSRALPPEAIEALADGADPLKMSDDLVAAWDFAHDISSTTVTDISPNGLHGRTVNMPTRAVTGANWNGSEVAFRLAPEQYGAIHFHEDDLEDAGWEADFSYDVPSGLRSGVYAARLMAGQTVEYVPFYVRPATGQPTAPVLYLAPTHTYLAYGNERLFGGIEAEPDFVEKSTNHKVELTERELFLRDHPELGASVYDLHPDHSGICYSSRLRPLVTMRPQFINWLNGCPRHFAADLFLIEWLERKGLAYDVVTDEDLHLDGVDLLTPYRVVVTGSHPEYWTTPMMDALETYLANGGRLMYLGGNGFYWVTGMDATRPHLIEVRRGINGTRAWTSHPGEIYLSLTGEPGGLWRYRGRTPNALTGVGFASEGWGGAPGYHRLSDSHDPRVAFIFDGIGDDEVIGDFGLIMGGAAGDEIDRYDLALGTPPETLRLATTEGEHTDYYQLVIEDCTVNLPGRGGTEEPRVRADITYLEAPNGGAVFSVGSINWSGSLPSNGFDNNVSRITENVLRRFAEL